MKSRLDIRSVDPQAIKAMMAASDYAQNSGLEESLRHLVLMRVSQINGCANCLHMHSEEARAAGETEARLYLLNAWHESLLYTPRERAALGWAESLTLVGETHAPDAVYEEARRHFSEDEMVMLTVLVCVINSWNRISIGFRVVNPSDRANAHAEAA
jgi:AhpD family alkylhydroperoxidase